MSCTFLCSPHNTNTGAEYNMDTVFMYYSSCSLRVMGTRGGQIGANNFAQVGCCGNAEAVLCLFGTQKRTPFNSP
jgi:hypothetical protein